RYLDRVFCCIQLYFVHIDSSRRFGGRRDSDNLFNCISGEGACRESTSNSSQEWCVVSDVHLLQPLFPFKYCSIALRMKVLLGISPRTLYVCVTNYIGNVRPTFVVLPVLVVPVIPVLYIVPLSFKPIGSHFVGTISVFKNFWKAGLNQP